MVSYDIEIRIVEIVKGPPEEVISAWFTKKAKGPCVPREGDTVRVTGHLLVKVSKVTHDPTTESVTVMLDPARVGSFEEVSKSMKRIGYK